MSIQELMGDMEVGVATVNLHFHIAMNFPRAWGYHHTGCYLLRTSFPGVDYHSDALLNFFKIGEMITAKMYSIHPRLRDIQRASRELGLEKHFTDDDIANFYRIRSRDAAHDWLTAEQVDREDAVDCKMWCESMLIYHWRERGAAILLMQRPGRPMFPTMGEDSLPAKDISLEK